MRENRTYGLKRGQGRAYSPSRSTLLVKDTMVFASNRPGGYEGYDLWYSIRSHGVWGEPVNFGSPINTASDEFRPILKRYEGIKNDLMIFSSNRGDGLGGFDLYYVGNLLGENNR